MIQKDKRPWAWIPILYFAEGLPYILVTSVSILMFKRLGISNTDTTLYASWLGLPWVFKFLWSPFVDLKSTKRKWFLAMQFIISICLFGVGLALPTNMYLFATLTLLFMIAFASATNDIASDGYYMIGLTEKKQSFFVGVRSTFYRLAVVTGSGLIVVIAGFLEEYYVDQNDKAWSITMICSGFLMLVLTISNYFATPKFENLTRLTKEKKQNFLTILASFFKKKDIGFALAFILTYRLGESQLGKVTQLFMSDNQALGGLELSTKSIGVINGTVGIIMLVLGGILGGFLISKDGLKKWMFPMVLSLNLPNILYAVLAWTDTSNIVAVTGTVIIEQFGYGFSFAGFLMFLIHVANGKSKTSHYAIATGFMALGATLPGMVSGYMQQWLGYEGFFIWVVLAGLPAIFLLKYLKYPADFGKKTNKTDD